MYWPKTEYRTEKKHHSFFNLCLLRKVIQHTVSLREEPIISLHLVNVYMTFSSNNCSQALQLSIGRSQLHRQVLLSSSIQHFSELNDMFVLHHFFPLKLGFSSILQLSVPKYCSLTTLMHLLCVFIITGQLNDPLLLLLTGERSGTVLQNSPAKHKLWPYRSKCSKQAHEWNIHVEDGMRLSLSKTVSGFSIDTVKTISSKINLSIEHCSGTVSGKTGH